MAAPHHDAAERATLANMILEPGLAPIIQEIIPEPTYFYGPQNQAIYKAICGLLRRGAPLDYVTISGELVRQGDIGRVGGKAKAETYIEELCQRSPNTSAFEEHARLVRLNGVRRLLVGACYAAADAASDGGQEILAAAVAIQKEAAGLMTIADYNPPTQIGLAAEAVVEDLVDRKTKEYEREHSGIAGHSSGWPELDDYLGGLEPGTLTIIAARPGDGKTTLALNLAENLADPNGQNLAVHFQSLEQSTAQLAAKALYSRAEVDSMKARKALTTDEEDERIVAELEKLQNYRIFIDDQKGLTYPHIRARAMMAKHRYDVSLLIIDYVQKIKRPPRTTQTEHVNDLAQALPELAAELNLPIIGICQLNRGVEQRRGKNARPMMSDLRDGGFLEQEAHNILLLHPKRDEVHDGHDIPTDLIVAKARTGKTGDVHMIFKKALGRFAERPAVKAEDFVNTEQMGSYYEKDSGDTASNAAKAPGW